MLRMFLLHFISIVCLNLSTLSLNTALADATPEINLPLIMGTSNGPPYMIQATESGLDIDIPRAALAKMGFPLELEFYPLSRAIHELQMERIHLTAPFFTNAPQGIYISDSHIEYRPSVITLNTIGNLQNLSDLKDYSIATFQGATGYFGDAFYKASKLSPDYVEHHDMGTLVDLLMGERYQVIVLDYWIFQHFLAESNFAGQGNRVTFHELIPRVPAAVAFTDPQLRDSFNKGLKLIKQDGTYSRILRQYQRQD